MRLVDKAAALALAERAMAAVSNREVPRGRYRSNHSKRKFRPSWSLFLVIFFLEADQNQSTYFRLESEISLISGDGADSLPSVVLCKELIHSRSWPRFVTLFFVQSLDLVRSPAAELTPYSQL
jgi:hypothetical protein